MIIGMTAALLRDYNRLRRVLFGNLFMLGDALTNDDQRRLRPDRDTVCAQPTYRQ
jgi:hypothetical protein